jgi:hypothetical protein
MYSKCELRRISIEAHYTVFLNMEGRRIMAQNQGNQMSQVEIQQCIQDCLSCSDVCLQTAINCQKAGGDHAKPEHISMLQDCAEMCMTTAHFLQHNSPLSGSICQACAEVCNHCAGECEQMGDTDCANACRNTAWSCEQLAKLIP